MKVKVKVAHSMGGGVDVEVGQVLDLSENDAKVKIAEGLADAYTGREPGPAVPVGRSPAATHSDPKVTV